ncbi:hypothetical protein CDV36_014002 [Fusarium kuroshium]|uniref:Uncharacterized protein n=3 Tax=Fusarium solani species complex TaxID=232080 RepID=A0A3M2RJI6_9HYPO|nr:hypothetical protein CDV36_014002 [Fusarium kuroshium]RSL62392.1 hypothetical protein CEP51_013479 [Fusarium floridanum]RSL83619.1 hypothetical protein CDV31_016814 [Fusarium ambrosium]
MPLLPEVAIELFNCFYNREQERKNLHMGEEQRAPYWEKVRTWTADHLAQALRDFFWEESGLIFDRRAKPP